MGPSERRERINNGMVALEGNQGISAQIENDRQLRLQQQQIRFQQQLQLQQEQQHQFQSQVAARYGAQQGQPLTGAISSPQLNSPIPQDAYGFDQRGQNMFNPMLNDSWNMLPTQGRAPAPSYNPQLNLLNELEMLRARQHEIEALLGQSMPQPPFQPPPQQQHPWMIIEPHLQQPMNKRSRSDMEDADNMIDPSLFESYQIMDIHNSMCPQMKHIDLECNGLLEHNSLLKRDYIYGIFFFYLLRHDDQLPESKLGRTSERFSQMIQNPKYQYEDFYKYEPSSLAELVKSVEKKLPIKKIIWLMIQKFFTSIAHPFCPALNETQFTEDITKIIGERDNSDSKVKLNISISSNEELITLLKLMFIVRIVQISLLTTTRPDKNSNFLLKNSQPSHDFEFLIGIFFAALIKFDISEKEKMKLQLMNLFLTLISFNGKRSLDYTPSNLLSMALQLDINNQNDVNTDETLKQIWYNLYNLYYQINIQNGLPIFLSEEFFNIELGHDGETGQKFQNSIRAFYSKLIEVYKVVRRLMNVLHKNSKNGVNVSSIVKLLDEYDNVMEREIGTYENFKHEIGATYSEKVLKVVNSNIHKLTKSNILSLIMLHVESQPSAPREELMKYALRFQNLCHEAISDIFDIIQNYNLYFNSGYEFIVFSSIFMLLEKLLKELMSFLLRVEFYQKPYNSLLKFFLNVIEELDGYPVLKNYFQLWRLQNRTKILLHMLKRHYNGEINVFELRFEYNGEVIDFTGFPTQFPKFDDHAWALMYEGFNKLNERFDTKYSNINSKKELFDSIDFPEPEFNIEFFH
jgi:hypothetical protein